MRIDGRRTDALRPVKLELGYTAYAEGSVLITQGRTAVLCNATVEDRLPAWLLREGAEHGWVTAEYGMLPRSTHTRSPRETTPQARTQEIRRLIARSLRAAVDLNLLGRRQIVVDCDVLQADGSTRTASVTGGYVALALALRKLIAAGDVRPEIMLAPVAAVSVGVVAGQALLDLCYEEDVRTEVDLNAVMNADGRFVELQGTAEGQPFDRATLNRLLDLAAGGIGDLLRAQRAVLDSE
ncbi:MAG: ribonuclease PH [Chloroflexi bacterium HGW-Chloroflexi-1]|nr:MAG: ribonuclease PH [Chloroflexi bacterium HGW-Chloroflexi-1]